jgi:hypothetical protein
MTRSMSGPSPLPLTEREAFEEWAVRVHGKYTLSDPDIGSMWSAWKARGALESAVRASLLVPAERCACGYPMPCALTVPVTFCKKPAGLIPDPAHQGIGPSTVERGASNTAGASGAPKRV